MIAIVSVHADDAVYSCGEFIARQESPVKVVTLCGGWPDDEHDRVWQQTLNTENIRACAHLGAVATYLPFLDGKWETPTPDSQVMASLADELAGAVRILVPLGIHHHDHLRYARPSLLAALATDARVAIYEDLPYRVMYPEEMQDRRAAVLDSFGHDLESAATAGHLKQKLDACAMYASQWGDDAQRCCSVYERIWWVR